MLTCGMEVRLTIEGVLLGSIYVVISVEISLHKRIMPWNISLFLIEDQLITDLRKVQNSANVYLPIFELLPIVQLFKIKERYAVIRCF